MDKKEFIDMWAPLAMEHQIRYGIPASVTLAQAAIESGWGSSELYTKQNACFGVKLGNKKGQEGKDYVVREDDRKDDKFRIYESNEQDENKQIRRGGRGR